MVTIPATWTVLQHLTRDYEVDRGPLEGTSRVVQVAAVRDIGEVVGILVPPLEARFTHPP